MATANIDELLDKVAELLNEASLSAKESIKISNLKHVQEIIMHQCPTLLDNFIEEILPFQCDKSAEVKKFVVSFLEDACKRDSEVIFKVIDNLRYLLFDENVNVQKRSYLAMINVYKNILKWIARQKKGLDESQLQTWQSLVDIKTHIVAQLDSDNDGVRTTAIKFLEMLIIVLSARTRDSLVPALNQADFSLDQLANEHAVLDKHQLLDEGHQTMRKLLDYTLSTHISSVNLISSICVLSNVAKQRPDYMNIVLTTYAKLLKNMPPTLGQSQVSAVRKQIKLQIFAMLKNPCSIEFQSDIAALLSELGSSANEIARSMPKVASSESRKRHLTNFSLDKQNAKQQQHNQQQQQQQQSKKSRMDTGEQPAAATDSRGGGGGSSRKASELESIADELAFKLNVRENVADLVMVSMAFLPEHMPAVFLSTYKPIAAAGTQQQIRHLARMLAAQLDDAGLLGSVSKGALGSSSSTPAAVSTASASSDAAVAQTAKGLITLDDDLDDDDNEEGGDADGAGSGAGADNMMRMMTSSSSTLVGVKSLETKQEMMDVTDNATTAASSTTPTKSANHLLATPPSLKPLARSQASASAAAGRPRGANRTFKLGEVTNEWSAKCNTQSVEELLFKTYDRILASEETVNACKKAATVRRKVLVDSASTFNYENYLTNYIFEDVRKRMDIALTWIFNNYVRLKELQLNQSRLEAKKQQQRQQQQSATSDGSDDDVVDMSAEDSLREACEHNAAEIGRLELVYDKTLYTILFSLQQRQDVKDFLFSKTICQVPLLTENCLKLLKTFCHDEQRYYFSLNTLADLITTRHSQRATLIALLLDFTHTRVQLIRAHALTLALKLYDMQPFHDIIQEYSIARLNNLVAPHPPAHFVDTTMVDMEHIEAMQWTEDSIQNCLYLFLELTPVNHSLIHALSQVYITAIAEVKRVILKILEAPIKRMTQNSAQLLRLIDEFAPGAETLVLRIIHILTETQAPTPELVNRVRHLFQTRLPDVRFLIPILTGLSKTEIISALPQMIKLSQPVVKEVFNRLLGINAAHKCPITPAELLVALHQIDPATCDLKTVIAATSLCFAEKQIFTQEILAIVMQQLIDVTPIPILYMRTVIQSVTMYPKLTGFVIIMMQRLIGKQVWKYPKVWEGFIKCCQRIKLISHQVLLQLPRAQLVEVFTTAPDLKEHIVKHVVGLNPQQRSQIPDQLIDIIENNGHLMAV